MSKPLFQFLAIFIALLSFSASYAAEKAKTADDYLLYLKSGDRSPKWNEFIEPGFRSFDSGNLATAFVFLNKAYESGCRDGLLLMRLGIYKESKGQFKEASALLSEAAQKIPKQYPGHSFAKEIHEHAGRVLYQAGDYDAALLELQKAIESAPNSFMLLFMTGQIMRQKKQFASAKQMFEKAMTAPLPEGLPPDSRLKVQRELMILAFELKDLDACLSYAGQILSLAPADPIAISYKQRIEKERLKKKEREMIEKMVK